MANGDLDGDLGTAGMTPEQRAALKARLGQQTGELRSARMNLADLASGTRQTSFDESNTPAKYLPPTGAGPAAQSGGPVGRATQQIGGPSPTSAQESPQTGKPLNLADAFSTGIGDGRSAINASVGANGEASFSNAPSSLNSLATNFTAPKLPPEQRVTSLAQYAPQGLAQAATMQPRQGTQPMALEDLSPGGRTTPSPPQRSMSLADAGAGGGVPYGSTADLASLGSARNLGDGIGTFSQAAAGDSALAMGRFQKANDLRNAYQDQDRLRNAVAAQARDSHFNVVRDSSQPVTRRELQFNEERKNTTQSLADAYKGAQGIIDNRRQGQASDLQQRQALRLEDAFVSATAPGASKDSQDAYLKASAPAKYLELQASAPQRAADLRATEAKAEKDQSIAQANGRKVKGLPSTLQKFEDEDIEAIGSIKTMNGSLDRISSQIGDGSLQLSPLTNSTSAIKNAVGSSDEVSTNYASFNATLEKLRNESLRLNKGTQTNDDAVRAWNELITNINDPKIVQQRIKEISGYNSAAASIRTSTINNRRKNQGLDDLNVDQVLSGAGAAQLQGQPQQPNQSAQAPARSDIATPDDAHARVVNQADVDKLPSGATFITPDGSIKRKP